MATVKTKLKAIGMFQFLNYISTWNSAVNCMSDTNMIEKFHLDSEGCWNINSCSGRKGLKFNPEKKEIVFYGSREWVVQSMDVSHYDGKTILNANINNKGLSIHLEIIEVESSLPDHMKQKYIDNPFSSTGLLEEDFENSENGLSKEEIQEDKDMQKLELMLSK